MGIYEERSFIMYFLFVILISTFFFFPSNELLAKEITQNNLSKVVNKVSNKFSRTYCNTTKFGISNEGALEFALGETNKEFSKNKLIKDIDSKIVFNKILSNIEAECQIYDFPIEELSRLTVLNIK